MEMRRALFYRTGQRSNDERAPIDRWVQQVLTRQYAAVLAEQLPPELLDLLPPE